VRFTVSETALVTITATTDPQWINITNLGDGNFGSIEFNPDGTPNATSNDCDSPTYEDTQSYYWCNGSPRYPVYQGETLPGNTGMVSLSLEDEVSTHVGDIIIIPIYSEVEPISSGSGANAEYTIVGFLAVKLLSVQLNGDPDDRGFKVEYVDYTATPGSFSSGAED